MEFGVSGLEEIIKGVSVSLASSVTRSLKACSLPQPPKDASSDSELWWLQLTSLVLSLDPCVPAFSLLVIPVDG